MTLSWNTAAKFHRSSVYGCPRKSPSSPRFNKGVPKKRANLKSMIGSVGQNSDKVRVADLVASMPESHFIQTRREAEHQQLVKDEHLRKVESYVEPPSALNAWDERHEVESEWSGEQTQKRQIEALREQHLSVDEGSADMDLRAAAVEFEQNQIKAQRAREEKQSKQFTQQVGMKPTEVFSIIKDLQVFIVNVDVPRQIIEKLKDVTRMADADVFVVQRIDDMDKENPFVSWHSSLRGCWVVSVELLACDERGGGAVKFRPALKCKRFVFFIDASKRTHGRTLKFIKRLNRFTWNKLEFLDDEAAFRAKSTAMKNSGSVVGVCGSDELPNYSEGSVKRHMGTINQFHVWLQKHDAQQCCFPRRRFLHLSCPTPMQKCVYPP